MSIPKRPDDFRKRKLAHEAETLLLITKALTKGEKGREEADSIIAHRLLLIGIADRWGWDIARMWNELFPEESSYSIKQIEEAGRIAELDRSIPGSRQSQKKQFKNSSNLSSKPEGIFAKKEKK